MDAETARDRFDIRQAPPISAEDLWGREPLPAAPEGLYEFRDPPALAVECPQMRVGCSAFDKGMCTIGGCPDT